MVDVRGLQFLWERPIGTAKFAKRKLDVIEVEKNIVVRICPVIPGVIGNHVEKYSHIAGVSRVH
jgi:hypothetical protein